MKKQEEKTRTFGQKEDFKFWSDKPIQEGHPKFKKNRTTNILFILTVSLF